TPDNRVLSLAAGQDYLAFYREEIGYRKVGLYPPFCDIACIVFASESCKLARESADRYAAQFSQLARERFSDLPIRVLGPGECAVFRAAGRYRYRMIVKCRWNRRTRELFWEMMDWYHRLPKSATIYLDPYYNGSL